MGRPIFSYAAQHGPIHLNLLDQGGTLACTFSEGGLTPAFAFDVPIACIGDLKQHLHIQCSTVNGSTSPGTIAATIGGTQYGVSSYIFFDTRSWKKRSDQEILRR
jgi:hypothetical protein